MTDLNAEGREAAVRTMRENPFVDDAHLLGTTQQDDRVAYYAELAIRAYLAALPPASGQDGVTDMDEAADAIWEKLLPFMQVSAHADGSRNTYKDKVASLAIIRAALSAPKPVEGWREALAEADAAITHFCEELSLEDDDGCCPAEVLCGDPNCDAVGCLVLKLNVAALVQRGGYAGRIALKDPSPTGWRLIDDDPPPMDGRSVWLAFEPEDWMCCEGRFQNGAWVIAATFYDPNRTPPMSYRETRLQPEKSPAYWMPMPEAPKMKIRGQYVP